MRYDLTLLKLLCHKLSQMIFKIIYREEAKKKRKETHRFFFLLFLIMLYVCRFFASFISPTKTTTSSACIHARHLILGHRTHSLILSLLLTATVDKRAGDREVDSKKKKRKEKKNARWIHSFIHST